jgi:hypothetical protein
MMAKKLPLKWFPSKWMAQIKLHKVDEWAEHWAKHGSPYFDTWEEAHEYMLEKAIKRVDMARKDYTAAERYLARVKVLAKPQDTAQITADAPRRRQEWADKCGRA